MIDWRELHVNYVHIRYTLFVGIQSGKPFLTDICEFFVNFRQNACIINDYIV